MLFPLFCNMNLQRVLSSVFVVKACSFIMESSCEEVFKKGRINLSCGGSWQKTATPGDAHVSVDESKTEDDMKKFATCFGFAVVGFIIAFGLYMTLGIFLLKYLQHRSGGSPESYLGIAFMLVLPVCLAIGSFASGYLCQPHIRRSYLFIALCPGLYAVIFVIATTGRTIEGFFESMLLCGVVWIFSSLVGVYAGKYLRGKRGSTRVRSGN